MSRNLVGIDVSDGWHWATHSVANARASLGTVRRLYGSESMCSVSPSVEGPNEQVHAVGRYKQDFVHLDRGIDQPAVSTDDRERPLADRKTHITRAGGVHDPPALDLSRGDRDLGFSLSVHETHVAFDGRRAARSTTQGA